MYCPYCQATIVDDAVFCNQCGKRVQPNSTPEYREQQAQSQLKSSSLFTLNQMIQHFSQKQKVYDQYDTVCSTLNWLSRGASNALVIWGGIVLGLFALCLLIVISTHLNDPHYYKNVGATVLMLVIFTAVPGALMMSGGITKKNRQKTLLTQCQQQYMELSRELYQHYRSYPNCPIPPEYTNPRIITKIKWLIASEQASTVKEGLNHMLANSNHTGCGRYHEVTIRNAADCNWKTGIKVIFLPPRYFK